jgi:MFS family permease
MPSKKYFSGLTPSTFLLAFTSFFADISTEMLYPVLPVFLTQTLGAGPAVIGLIEGIAPALQNIVQGISGWFSDKLRRRKYVAVAGYAIAAVAKPLIGLSTVWTGVLFARSLDRFGTGTRSAPRDALVASSADDVHRGKAFGLEGFGDNLGAFVGPIVTVVLMGAFAVQIRSIFLLAFIPAALAALCALFVREKHITMPVKEKLDIHVERFPRRYWIYIAVTALFGLGNSTNAFLILRTKDLGVSLSSTILIYACFNLVAALASYPAGYLSDVLGRKRLLIFAFLIFIAVYAGFALVQNIMVIAALFGLYGIFQGIFRAVGKALAADCVPPALRATGIGWYATTIGLSGLIASLVGGLLWSNIGPQATFMEGMAFAIIGTIGLMLFVHQSRT